ncbi:MAG: homoserine kinase [Actinomycetota bacterium]|nr:homoserine kinase [Actinomycetota bacterium]
MQRRRLVRVPASTANLGPGFDAFAAALALHVELEVVETGVFAVETDLAVARDRRNLAVRGFAALHPPDDFTFRIRSTVPLSGGLGSSAAAYVAGLLAADSMFELDADVLAEATALEGHPDNAAAALMGGVVICVPGWPARLDPPPELEALLVVPDEPVRTRKARQALPHHVPMADAVHNLAHASLLTLGLERGDLDMVSRSLHDRLHQPHRAHLYPRSTALLERARELGALGATVSGAGPTVMVWCHFQQTGGLVDALRGETDGWARVMRVPFEPHGAVVREL